MKSLNRMILAVAITSLGIQVLAGAEKVRKKVSEEVKRELLNVFTENEKLNSIFFEYEKNVSKIEGQAKKLSQSIGEISDPEIKELLSFSQGKLSEISSKSRRADNNQRYHLLSMALIHVMKTYDIGDAYNAYSCPMVKMKWVQNTKKTKKVRNPYSSEMPHCGSKDSDY